MKNVIDVPYVGNGRSVLLISLIGEGAVKIEVVYFLPAEKFCVLILFMLNFIFLIVAGVCGAALVWLGYVQSSHWGEPVRYGVAFVSFLGLVYWMSWLNDKLMRKEVAQWGGDEQEVAPEFAAQTQQRGWKRYASYLGHVILLCGVLLLAWGWVAKNMFVLAGALPFVVIGIGFLCQGLWQRLMGGAAGGTTYFSSDPIAAVQGGMDTDDMDAAPMDVHQVEGLYADARVAAPEIIRQIQAILKEQEGRIRMESMLCVLGALAGYACQRSLLVEVSGKGDTRSEQIRLIQTEDGASFFDGEPLNYHLFQSSHSIWELALVDVRLEEELPDLDDILRHTVQSMGTPDFGVPRLAQGQYAPYLPVEYVKMMWPSIFSMMRLVCQDPQEWAVAFGFAIQKVLGEYKEQLEMGLALRMVMESAIPMSRINLFEHFSKDNLYQ